MDKEGEIAKEYLRVSRQLIRSPPKPDGLRTRIQHHELNVACSEKVPALRSRELTLG